MCDCIERINAKLDEDAPNTTLLLPMWSQGAPRVFIETTKRDEKKRGKPAKMFATFCPFCGEKYDDARERLGRAAAA